MRRERPSLRRPKLGPLSVLRALWKHRLLITATSFLLTLAGVVIVFRLPAIYRAETRILVETQRIPEKFVESTVNSDLRDRLNALSQQILSYKRLLVIVESYNLYREERRSLVQEEILEMMRRDIEVHLEESWTQTRPGQGRPAAFLVSYQGPDRQIVAKVANELGNLFIEENLRAREVQAAGTSEFLDNQLSEAKHRLEEQEAKMTEYKMEHNGELPEQENALIATLNRLQIGLQGVHDAIPRAEQQRILIENSIASAETSEAAFRQIITELEQRGTPLDPVTGAPPQASMRDSEKLEKQIAVMLSRYTDKHPDVRQLQESLPGIRNAEANADKSAAGVETQKAQDKHTATADSKPNVRSLQPEQILLKEQERIRNLRAQQEAVVNELKSLAKDRDAIQARINVIQKRMENLPLREQQLAVVMRDYQISQANYKSLLDKKLAAEMATEMEHRQKAERFTIIDPARVPERPVKPSRPLLAGGCAAGALFLGIAISLIVELKRNTLLGDWELPKGVVILAHIPVIHRSGAEERQSKTALRLTAGITALLVLLACAGAVLFNHRFV